MPDFAALATSFVAAQLAGNRREALRVVVEDGVQKGARVIDLQAQVIAPAQREIGSLWQRNKITIAQEHLATGIAQVVMARLFEYVPPAPRNGKHVVVACVEGEHHEFPARLVADYLEHGGFVVAYYGADLPTHDLVEMLKTKRPHVLALSATMSFQLPSLRAAIAAVRAVLPTLPIVIGGHALTWSPTIATDLDVATSPPDPDSIIEIASRLAEAA